MFSIQSICSSISSHGSETNSDNDHPHQPTKSNLLPSSMVEHQKRKRAQVKIACISCKASCKKCDDFRPCRRCEDRGIGNLCVDAKRKPRQKGMVRGQYKKPWRHHQHHQNSNNEEGSNKDNVTIPSFSQLLEMINSKPTSIITNSYSSSISPPPYPTPTTTSSSSSNLTFNLDKYRINQDYRHLNLPPPLTTYHLHHQHHNDHRNHHNVTRLPSIQSLYATKF